MQREADHIAGVNVALRKNPFALGHVDRVLPAGSTIAEMIEEVGLRQTDELIGGVFVYVGDILIERQRWMDFTLAAGMIVSIGIVPSGGGGGGKDPTRTIAMLAVMAIAIAAVATAPYTAPLLGITSSTGIGIFGAVAGATISMAGSMLVNALIPLPTQKSSSEQSRNYISGISNVMDPYGPIPRIYGKRRVYPRIAAQPYSELLGNDNQYLRVLFCVGKGRYHLSDYKIGETALTEFEEYELDKYNSSNTLSSSLYPNDISETALTIELEYNSAQTRTTGEDIDEIQVEVTFPEGLYRISDGGERRSASVAIKCEYSIHGASAWREFSAFTRLNFTDYPSASIAAGQSITGPSGSGTVRYANKNWYQHPTGDYIDDGEGLNVPIYETIEYCDYVDVEVASGTFAVSDSVTIDSTYTASVSAVRTITPTIEEEIGQPFKRSWSVKVPRDQYDVRVTRTTDDEDKTYRSAYWTTLRTITNEPPWTLTGCTMLALRIKATGQLSGMLDTFNFWAEALVDAYDSETETWQIVKSRSPAWAFVDVLCGSSNLRPLAKSRLNLASILEFQAACTAKNFNYDIVIESRTTVWELLRQICAVGRAAPALTDNTYGVVLDKEQTTPIQHFSPRNSWGFSGSRVFVDVPHGLRCKFDNYNHDNAADERVVYDDGYSSVNATLFESVEFPGVTLPGHVWKLGRYHLACLRLRPETYVFNTDVEHMVCTRGDLVRLTHDVLMVGLGQARVKSITTVSVSLDDVFQQQTGTTYGIQFRRANGTFTTATIVTINGDNAAGTVFTISPAMAAGDLPAVGDLCFFGVSGSESNDVLVSRIEPGPDLSARITCIPYNEGILTADSGEIPDWDSGITLPPGYKRKPYKAKIIGAEYKYRENYVLTDGRYAIRIRVGFSVQESGFEGTGAVIDPFVQAIRQPVAFRPQYREDDGPWTPLPKVDADARHFGFKAKNNTSYDIRIRSISAYGTISDWDTLSNFETELVSVPPDVTGLVAIANGTELTDIAENGDFEAEEEGQPTDWLYQYLDPYQITFAYNSAIGRGSTAGISVQNTGGGAGYAQQQITVTPGETLSLSFWSKGDGSVAGRYSVYDADNDEDIVAITSTGNTSINWAQVSEEIIVPAECTDLRVRLHDPAASGTAYYDDVILARESAETDTWTTKDLEIEWDEVTADDGEAEITHYQVQVYTADGVTLLRTERAVENKYTYSFDKNLADGGPRASVELRVRARNSIKTFSANAASDVFTNPVPEDPQNPNTETLDDGRRFSWDENEENDFRNFKYRIKIGSGEWSSWSRTADNIVNRLLTDEEKGDGVVSTDIYIEVRAVDFFKQNSASVYPVELPS